jgi:sarcosine oxidase subunit alpha
MSGGDMLGLDFEGKRIEARPSDTVATALLRAGVTVFSRGPKYHRPRGPFCLAGICAQCHMRVDGEPNVPTCMTPAREGLGVQRQNVIGSGDTDLLRAVDFLYPDGIDHHHLMTGSRLLNSATKAIARRLAGIGEVPAHAVAPVAARSSRHSLVIVGAGAAGLAAAQSAARAGLAPLVLEGRGEVDGQPFDETGAKIRLELNARVVGLYEEGGERIVVVKTAAGLWQLQAERVVLATGAHERNLPFESNDLPGVFGGRALLKLVERHEVRPGARVVVIGAHPDAMGVARGLHEAGIEVVGVLDIAGRLPGGGDWPLFRNAEPLRALGRSKVLAFRARTENGDEIELRCDLIAVVAPRVPAYELAAEVGAKVVYNSEAGGFVIASDGGGRTNVDWLFVAGSVSGRASLESGERVGRTVGSRDDQRVS